MIICRYPTERATDGPCETCGREAWTLRHDDPMRHPFLGLPTRLCLHEEDQHEPEHRIDQPKAALHGLPVAATCVPCFEGTTEHWDHAYQEGEWCPTCDGSGEVNGGMDGLAGEKPTMLCSTCKGLKAVSVQVQA